MSVTAAAHPARYLLTPKTPDVLPTRCVELRPRPVPLLPDEYFFRAFSDKEFGGRSLGNTRSR